MNRFKIKSFSLERGLSGWSCMTNFTCTTEEEEPFPQTYRSGPVFGRFVCLVIWRARWRARIEARRLMREERNP